MSAQGASRFGKLIAKDPQPGSCFEDVINFITNNVKVEIPRSVLDVVTICQDGINVDSGSQLCALLDSSGNFKGFRQLIDGNFQEISPAFTNEIKWIKGRDNVAASNLVPPGWAICTDSEIRARFIGNDPFYKLFAIERSV